MLKKYYQKFKVLMEPIKEVKKLTSILFSIYLFLGLYYICIIYLSSNIIHAIEIKDILNLKFNLTIFIILTIIKLIVGFFDDGLSMLVNSRLENFLTKKYYKKYICLDNNEAEKIGTGKVNNIVSKGIENWLSFINGTQFTIISIFTTIYIFTIILIKSPSINYFFIFLFVFIFIVLIFWKGANISNGARKETKELSIIGDGKKVKIFMSKFEILQNDKIDKEISSIIDINTKIGIKWWDVNIKKNFVQIWAYLTLEGMQIIIYGIVGIGIIYGKYSLAYLALLIWLLQNLSKIAWDIRSRIRDMQQFYIHIDKLLETFDNISEIPGINNPIPFSYSKGNININNLTYGYTDDNIFSNFSLNISGGKKTALVGDSGSGKTTLMKLIAGYIHPKEGNIVVDNQNIQDINLISYYKNIGYLTQEPSVFDGTIMENLTYALDREPTKEELEETIKSSKCDFIYELPNGMETEIGERGVKLSGGQKQRLAIAKIMIKNPNIILLDEPTSALDSISEQIVSEAFHNLFTGRTVIVIAHRLQTVKEADEILVFKKGEIIERGNHTELSNKTNGEYKKMLDLQTSF